MAVSSDIAMFKPFPARAVVHKPDPTAVKCKTTIRRWSGQDSTPDHETLDLSGQGHGASSETSLWSFFPRPPAHGPLKVQTEAGPGLTRQHAAPLHSLPSNFYEPRVGLCKEELGPGWSPSSLILPCLRSYAGPELPPCSPS